MRSIILQGAEETGQGIASGLSQNRAIQENANPNQDITEGVGRQAAEGLIGGLSQAGISAIPATAAGTTNAAIDGIVKATTKATYNDPVRQDLYGGSPIDQALRTTGDTVKGTAKKVAKGAASTVDAASNLVSEQKRYNDPLRQDIIGQNKLSGATGIARALAGPIVDRIKNRDKKSEQAAVDIADELVAATETDPITSEQDQAKVSDAFRSTENEPFVTRVARITGTLASNRVKITDSDAAFAGNQYSKLNAMLGDLPKNLRTKAVQILQSPQAKAINKRFENLDQNTSTVPETITPNVVSETIAIASTYPANVNPQTVKKILEESDDTLTPEELKLLKSASKISSLVTDRKDTEGTLEQGRVAALTKKSGKPFKVRTSQDTSRSVRVAGYTSTDGKKLRSFNDFASDAFKANASPNGEIIITEGDNAGGRVTADEIMSDFENLIAHLTNKVSALNDSFSQNNREGTGPKLAFAGLVPGKGIVSADQWTGTKVFYNRSNPSSVTTAKQVEEDMLTGIEIYNELIDAFPDRYGKLQKLSPVSLMKDPDGYTTSDALNAEIDAQEAADIAQANKQDGKRRLRKDALLKPKESLIDYNDGNQNPAVIEEAVLPQAQTGNEQNQDSNQNVNEVQKSKDTNTPENLDDTPLVDTSTKDPSANIDQSNDKVVDKNGNPIKLYHGTNGENFDAFNDSKDGIFLTTRKGQAREFAIGKEKPRLVETRVRAKNPLLVEVTKDSDPQDTWLSNRSRIEADYKSGNHDAIIITKDEEAIVIVFDGENIEITNQNIDAEQSKPDQELEQTQEVDDSKSNLDESLTTTYQEDDRNPAPRNLDDYLEKVQNSDTMNKNAIAFAKKLIRPMIRAMNKRLQNESSTFDGKKMSLVEAIKLGLAQKIRQYKNTIIVDKTTGEYDQDMIELAGLAFVDWLSSVQARDPNQLDDTLEELGVSMSDMTEEQKEGILYGVSVAQAKNAIAKDILRMWGMRENIDAPLSELIGIAEGIAAEMISTLDESNSLNLIKIARLPLTLENGRQVETATIIVKGLENVQDQLKNVQGEDTNLLVREELFDVPSETYSIGKKIPKVPVNHSRGNLPLTPTERAAVATEQDTPHYKAEQRSALIEALGETALFRILGFNDGIEFIKNKAYKRSVEGKNLSVMKNVKEAILLIRQLKDGETPVYYPVGVTKTGRHSMQGPNPQTNKLIRMLVTPTWGVMNLNNQEHLDAFWLGIAQAAEIAKIEKVNQEQLLKTIQKDFTAKYGEAVAMIREFNETGVIDSETFADLIGVVEPQVISAIESVAMLQDSLEAGSETMNVSLSVELDGLTNGAANMMVNLGQGVLTKQDYQNFNRIGLFIGQLRKTVNDFFSVRGPNGERNLDMYERTSNVSQKNMFSGLKRMKSNQRAATLAAGRFAARFGNFEIVNGQIEMTRNTAKNPMTKINYGSTVSGVGRGIADDMLMEFYKQIQGIPTNTDIDTYFAYPGLRDDIYTLFGSNVPKNLRAGEFEFSTNSKENFIKNVTFTIGKVLNDSTRSIIGNKITEVNDMLVFSTNVQSEYVQIIFRTKLEELAARRAAEPNSTVRINKNTGNPIITDLSRRDYNSVVKEMTTLMPIFVSEDQTLAAGVFQTKSSNMVLSSNMKGKLNQKSHLPMPDSVGVSGIPYLVIGTGDAMMINLIFGADNAPKDVLQVYDGIDVPVLKLKEYGPQINEQVLKTWERDVFAMITNNFNGFLAKADPEIVKQAFQTIKDANKTKINQDNAKDLANELNERHRHNAARKAVFKRLGVSVDQMGGSSIGYTRDGQEMTLTEINIEIEKELNKSARNENKKEAKLETDVTIEIQQTTADAVLKGMRMTSVQKKIANFLAPFLKDTRVIIGTVDQMNQWRADNVPDDGQVLRAKSNYDIANNIIFLATTNTDSILHEMVHAATYNKVEAHYDGTAPNKAVTRLEALMEEFLALDNSKDGDKVREAKASIVRLQAVNNPASKSAALNEFMAYALGNQEVRETLKKNNTKTLVVIARKVMQLMRRMMGGIPATMFDNVVFNTRVLNETPLEDISGDDGSGDNGGGDNNGNGGNNDNTGGGNPFTNFWIDTITKYIQDNFRDANNLKKSFRPVIDLSKDVDKVMDGFRQVGMLANQEQRMTFQAIYMVMRSQIKLDPQSVIGLTRIFKHIEDNLTPDMFGNGPEAPQIYSAVVNSFDGPEAVATLLALSQTSKKFRDAVDQISDPSGDAQVNGSLNEMMGKFGQMFMSKIMGNVDFDNKNVQEIMNELAAGIVSLNTQKEYSALRKITGTFAEADKYVSGKMSELSNKVASKNQEIQRESRSKFVRILSNTITLGTNMLDSTNTSLTADAAKRATHMNVPFLSLVPIREMVTELIGTDSLNTKLVAMQDVVNFKISGMRQAYREDLPIILQNLFKRPPVAEEWAAMHVVLGQSDITRFMNARNIQSSMQMLGEGSRRNDRIQELEKALEANLLPYIAQDAKDKAQQLADYMNGKGAGKLLMRNAYAIIKNLDGNFEKAMVEVVDELVSIYILDQMDAQVRESVISLWNEDPKAVFGMITYIQGLNEAEDSKVGISEQALLNSYKGFIPNFGDKDTKIIIETDDNEKKLEILGYKKLGPYNGDIDSVFDRSYFVTTTRQGGAYSQGIMQNVQSTYRGVDITTGLTVSGESNGYVSGDGQVDRYLEILNKPDYVQEDDKETMIPVFDSDGTVSGFERAINPDVYSLHMKQEQNLAIQLGAWAGRHVEEALAAEYNRALIDELDNIYRNREPGTDDLFVNLKKTKDPIYKEAFSLWPQSAKRYADSFFDNDGPMILKSQINLSTGYREFSIADFWSGKTRLPKNLQKTVKNVSTMIFGKDALSILSTGEKIGQGAVSTAKDIIVIRSLIIPTANTASNIVQLSSRNVPNKMIVDGYRSKTAEIEEYTKNIKERIDLEAKLRLAANNANQRRIIKSKIQVIDDLNSKMTIAPIIEAGGYSNLSEGITELDANISKGKFGDIMEDLANKLPDKLGKIAHLGLVSKSTEIYKFANKATQYGDFIAKSIYYDFLMSGDINSLTHEEAIAKMNEEFVNFSTLPGRTRSGLESYGLTWFMAFKIRVAKIAMQQLRENPVRALAVNSLLPDIGSPVNDNIGQVIVGDRLGYATGYEMLFSAPGLNPWVNFLDG